METINRNRLLRINHKNDSETLLNVFSSLSDVSKKDQI